MDAMTQVLRFGRVCFALGTIGLGVTHFVFQQFTTGRAPAWPESLPGGVVWAYVSGAVVIAVGVALTARWYPRFAALTAATIIVGWALLRHIPLLLATGFLTPPWTAAGKALTLVGGMLAVAATSPAEPLVRSTRLSAFVNNRDEFVTAARVCLGAFLLITGAQHFIYTPFVASLIPPWFPGDAESWTYFAGVALLAGGVGLLIPQTVRLAALLAGLMVFSWFWIVHIPRTLSSVSDGIAVFEALAVAGIAFVIAGSSRHVTAISGSRPASVTRESDRYTQA
jgi:uncharacterized membrane protein